MEDFRADDISLTGVWQGRYSYPAQMEPVEFVATLIESGAHLSGMTREPGGAVGVSSGPALGLLSGERNGSHVLFTKTYENGHDHQIEYDGLVNAEGTEISGNWIIFGVWGGSFQMMRSTGATVAAERKATETIK